MSLIFRHSWASWHRPLYSLVPFLCANGVFWFLVLTSWRIYHLISLILLGLVMGQIIHHFILCRSRGEQLWRKITKRWDEMSKPKLSQCIAESWSSYTAFLQVLFQFKQRNPGKFCLLVCSVCLFFTILGSYIPGVVVSYLLLLFAFLCPLLKCNEFGQRVCSKVKPVLQKLDFGIFAFVVQWMKARSRKERNTQEDKSELDLSALCPQVNTAAIAKELSVSDTEPSDITWTDNGTFNLSEGYTPQTDTSDDFDHRSDEEGAFSRDFAEFPSLENGSGSNDDDSSIGLPTKSKKMHGKSSTTMSHVLGSEQQLNMISDVAKEAMTAAVATAITDQLQSVLLSSLAPPARTFEDTDTEEGDDFVLLDQSELEDIDLDLNHTPSNDPKDKKASSGFLSSLLGSH
ncbi:hypothetical protein GDO86_011343 [Hymenochirus boettgeri]|uniref:RETREG1-3/ARL6IP-like N-terminal reticulon-homology domain-containing protein n=1 Tax=Hymenochirus boettgeri TaxID=247094 RepID=A0A8T2JBB8_9PIPI|nr:hypothetical protein GDO86_011343 [Hymenochirus boettgeri]